MDATPSGPVPFSPPSAAVGTIQGATNVRQAISRLRSLAAVALTIAVLVLVLDALNAGGVLSWTVPTNLSTITDWWTFGVQIGVLVAFGIAIVALFIAGIVYAITGVFAWRRGVVAMNASSFEYGDAHVAAARQAREDHSLTLWMMVIFVAAGIAVSIATAAMNATLDATGHATLSSAATTVAGNLAGAVVLVVAYHFGSRSLVGLLFGLTSSSGQQRLIRGRNLLLAGALVGLGGAFAPISWLFNIAVIASLALIFFGASELLEAYTEWLDRGRAVPSMMHGVRVAPV